MAFSLDTLFTTPDSYRYDSTDEGNLRRQLAEYDKNSMVTPCGSPKDVLINEDTGKTRDGFSYTSSSLAQLCSLASSGLAYMVYDIAGRWRKSNEDRRDYSVNLAINMVNRVVTLRFNNRLLGFQILRNMKEKTIDSIVSPRYRHLINSDFLDRVASVIGREGTFHEACLYGRHMMLRYKAKGRKSSFPIGDEEFSLGFNFGNSEFGGHSVRGTTAIIRNTTGHAALTPYTGYYGRRVVHSGKDFDRRVLQLISKTFSKRPRLGSLTQRGSMMFEGNLGLDGNPKNIKRSMLASMLNRRKLTVDFANTVITRSLYRGREDEDISDNYDPDRVKELIGERTEFDLFVTLIREASKLNIEQREIAETAAYELMLNKSQPETVDAKE